MNHGVILYDFLFCRGGAERVTLELARGFPGSEICVAFRDKEAFPDSKMAGVTCHELQRIFSYNVAVWRTLSGMAIFSRNHGFLKSFDWAIFSGTNAPLAVLSRPGQRNLYYCHTIPRFAYDLHQVYLTGLPTWQRPFFRVFAAQVRKRYEPAIRKMDQVLVNSRNVQQRVDKHLGLPSQVVHPPCDVHSHVWKGQEGYYLSTSRLEWFKRVDVIVQAFAQMPEKKLVVASGGGDEKRLKRLAEGARNITFTGWMSDAQLRDLMGRCIATVYIPRDEDFGMSPVESMAAGKPVIGVAEGGLLETVVPGETGLLLPPDPGPEDLIRAVHEMTPARALSMRRACELQAAGFSTEIFLDTMRSVLDRQG